jgi:hypothetical protein
MRGSCLCGDVRYEVTGPLHEFHHCHCSRCRKAHGAPFGTYAGVARADLRFLRGEESVRAFQSSERVERSFCPRCGSSLFFRTTVFPDSVWIAAGSFDDTPEIRPAFHIFVASKAPWHEITDALPQFAEYPE